MSTPPANQPNEQKKFFKIVSIVPVPPRTPFAEEKEYIVLIQLWDGRPLSLRVKESELTEEKLKELVKKELEKTRMLEGKVISLE